MNYIFRWHEPRLVTVADSTEKQYTQPYLTLNVVTMDGKDHIIDHITMPAGADQEDAEPYDLLENTLLERNNLSPDDIAETVTYW